MMNPAQPRPEPAPADGPSLRSELLDGAPNLCGSDFGGARR